MWNKKRQEKNRCARAQGSIEYLMMLSAVSIVVVIALAMVTQLKGAALHSFLSANASVPARLARQLANLTNASGST